ncbi:MAG TPA: YsnF/AvaK domain-containing protein [Sphingobacteriaceae bacterium]|nr:YsnF/AvaK domain-containing protein [Sphingobacteriaceae bacterium]
MKQTVIGIFERQNEANEAMQNLLEQGFNREDIDLVQNNRTSETHDDVDNDDFGSSISNFFQSLFGSDDDRASNHSEVAKRCSTLTVQANSGDEAKRAANILDDFGAVDVEEKASEYRNNLGGSDVTASYSDFNESDTNARSIPVIEENIEIGKKEVETGGVRIRSHIVEKPVEENVRLRSEHVNVERTSVDRLANENDLNTFQEGTIEMTEHKEVPVIDKEAWVKEEISLNKEVEETDETIHDTVRKTEVEIENIDEDEDIRKPNFNANDDLDENSFDREDRNRV